MPFINVKVTGEITPDKEKALKDALGKAIELMPGKSENHLMIGFEDKQRLWFRGENGKPMAFVEVKIFGKSTDEGYAKMTAEVTDIMQRELGVEPDMTYVKYEEIDQWGHEGVNY